MYSEFPMISAGALDWTKDVLNSTCSTGLVPVVDAVGESVQKKPGHLAGECRNEKSYGGVGVVGT